MTLPNRGGKGEDRMTRDEAEELLKKYVKTERMLDHSFAAEAVLGRWRPARAG